MSCPRTSLLFFQLFEHFDRTNLFFLVCLSSKKNGFYFNCEELSINFFKSLRKIDNLVICELIYLYKRDCIRLRKYHSALI